MKVGDLIWDETYGAGIVISTNEHGAQIVFENKRMCHLDRNLFHTVEVINESRLLGYMCISVW